MKHNASKTMKCAGGLAQEKTSYPSLPGVLLLFAVVFLVAIVTGCQSTETSTVGQTGGIERTSSQYLAAGDVVSFSFPSAVEMNQSQKIRIDGKITLPMVGEVVAAGKSPMALQEDLMRNFGPHLVDPKVFVIVQSSSSAVYVNGAVARAGKVTMDRPMTVFEAVMESGGFSPTADRRKVFLTRQAGGAMQRQQLNLRDGDGRDGITPLRPFDTITVGESWF